MNISETNVFFNIVKNEDANTELLKSFLQFKSFRDSFLELTNLQLDLEKISFEDFSTQTILVKNGRPDLVLKNEGLGLELFFEVKVINSNLTENQPYGYLKELYESHSKVKGLFFIIPKFYNHRNKLTIIELNQEKDRINTRLIFWDDIIDILNKINDSKNNQLLSHYLNYLRIRFHIYPVKYSFKEIDIMFNSDTPNGLEKTFQLIYDACHKVSFPIEMNKKLEDHFTKSYNYYISFMLPNSKNQFFIGIWLDYWKKEGNPICFGVQKYPENDNIKNLFNKITKDLDFPESIEFSEDKNNPYLITYFKKEILINDKFLDKVEEISKFLSQYNN